MPIRRPARAAAPVSLVAALLLALTGCGNDDTGDDTGNNTGATPSSTVDSALAAKVPASVKSDGTLLVGTDSTYAPSEFLAEDGKTIQGFDIDVFSAVAAKLGLKAQFQTATFGDIITGVNAGKYEVGVSSFTINADRLKQANMVSYFSAGTQWATQAGNKSGIAPDNACGKNVAVQKDTVQVDDLTARSKACTDAGKPAIKIDQYAAQDRATAAVVAGKDDAMLADSPVAAYAVQKTGGKLELLGDIYDSAPYGYVIPKAQTELAEAIRDALKAVIADGSYEAALKKWGVEAGAIADPQVNPSV